MLLICRPCSPSCCTIFFVHTHSATPNTPTKLLHREGTNGHVFRASKQPRTSAPTLPCRLQRTSPALRPHCHDCVARSTEYLPEPSPQILRSTSHTPTRATFPDFQSEHRALSAHQLYRFLNDPERRKYLLGQVQRRVRICRRNDSRLHLFPSSFLGPLQSGLPTAAALKPSPHSQTSCRPASTKARSQTPGSNLAS